MSGSIDNYYIVPRSKRKAPIVMCYIEEVRKYIASHKNFKRYSVYDKTLGTLYTPKNEVIWYDPLVNVDGQIKLAL